ncbi:MAG: hypothetical protein IT306_22750 [Chloroflexi bacterium]|nr:hypothetical protein [Chloroflexota bacterium]
MRELAAVWLAALALTLGLYTFGTTHVGLQKDDAGQYYQMAESPSYLARLPYSFRVFSPGVAGLWPGDPVAGFTALTLLALPLVSACLYAYQRTIELSRPAALAGALLFAVSGGAIRMLTTPVYVDAVTYLTEAAAFWLLARRQFWPFLAVVTVGVLNRETSLLLVAVYLAVEPPSRGTLARAALAVALPGLLFCAVVLAKLAAGGVLSGATPVTVLAPFARTFQQTLPTLPELFDVYSTLGVLWLLGVRRLPGPTGFQRRALVYGALVVLQLTVSRGDEGRNLSHLFPLLIPLAMLDVERLWQSGGQDGRLGRLLAAVLIVACALSMIHARWTILESATVRYGLVAVGTGVALVIAWGGPLLLRRNPPLTPRLRAGEG